MLLDDVADVVEVGEGGRQLVQVVGERVQHEVGGDALHDVAEADGRLREPPLRRVVQSQRRGRRLAGGSSAQRLVAHLRVARDRPANGVCAGDFAVSHRDEGAPDPINLTQLGRSLARMGFFGPPMIDN